MGTVNDYWKFNSLVDIIVQPPKCNLYTSIHWFICLSLLENFYEENFESNRGLVKNMATEKLSPRV